jgi:hypothetical protein
MKLTFWRNENYDLSKTVRKLPYSGKSWFVIRTVDKPRLLEFINNKSNPLNIMDFTFKDVDVKEIKGMNIKAIDLSQANKYVLGESDIAPEDVSFNYKLHASKFVPCDVVSMGILSVPMARYYGFAPYNPKLIFHVLIPENFL